MTRESHLPQEHYSETAITAAFNELVAEIRTDKNRFRFVGPTAYPDGALYWGFSIEKEEIGTSSAEVRFYPLTGKFEGNCLGEFTFDKLGDVIERLKNKFHS